MAESLKYLPQENALLCSRHGYAITLDRLDNHLTKTHHLKLRERQTIVEHWRHVAPRATSPSEVCYNAILLTPPDVYADLQVPTQGFACHHCQFVSINYLLMQRHVKADHGLVRHRGREEGLLWFECLLQTFFRGHNERRWFRVQQPILPPRPNCPRNTSQTGV